MVVRARTKSAKYFGVLMRKYMGWHGVKDMNPISKVMSKVLYKGMIGYCLKDSGYVHFNCAMYNISNVDVTLGKILHSLYGKANLEE